MFSLETLITQRIGFGRYQIKAMIVLALIDINDGAELMAMTFMNPIIKREWKLTNEMTSTLTSMLFFGAFIGSFLSGRIADVYGRKPAIKWSAIFYFFISNLMALTNSYGQLIYFKFLYGLCKGFALPLSTSMISQIVPLQFRGKAMVFVNLFVTIGKLFGIFLVYLTLDTYHSGNWRLLISLHSIIGLSLFLASHFILDQTARFNLCIGNVDQGQEIVNKMIQTNKRRKAILLSDYEKRCLSEWKDTYSRREDAGRFSAIFSDGLSGITFQIWLIWILQTTLSIGQMQVMHYIFDLSARGFRPFLMAAIGEIPSIVVALLIIDYPSLGRKNSLFIGFFLGAIFNIFCFLCDYSILPTMMSLARLTTKQSFAILFPYTCQIYRTNIRTTGFGAACGMGQIGAATVPHILMSLTEGSFRKPFILFSIISGLSALLVYTLPFDTLGQRIDEKPYTELVDLSKQPKIQDSSLTTTLIEK